MQSPDSDDPFILIASIFKDTVLGFGIDPNTAENAQIAFYALKRTHIEETQQKIQLIASNMDLSPSLRSDSDSLSPSEFV